MNKRIAIGKLTKDDESFQIKHVAIKLNASSSLIHKEKSREKSSFDLGELKQEEKVWSNLEGTLAVVASETGFVIDLVVSSELIHQIHCLLTCFALLGSPCKWCHLKLHNSEPHWMKRIPFFFLTFLYSQFLPFTFSFSHSELCVGRINSSDSDKFRGAVENVGLAYDGPNFQIC